MMPILVGYTDSLLHLEVFALETSTGDGVMVRPIATISLIFPQLFLRIFLLVHASA